VTPAMIPFDAGQERLDWLDLVAALKRGHQAPKAEIEDLFLYRGSDTLLSRSAWIDGMGLLTKTATVFPNNPKSGQPMIGGGVMLFDDATGALAAVIDFHLITKWKTAGDSLMAALALAPAGAREILIVGAGTVGRSLVEAFGAGFPEGPVQHLEPEPQGGGGFCARDRCAGGARSAKRRCSCRYYFNLHHDHGSDHSGGLAASGATS